MKRRTKPKAADWGPRWPVAYEAAKWGGAPFAASVVGVGDELVIVSIDGDGVLVELERKRFRWQVVRWCLMRSLRFYSFLAQLADAIDAGHVRVWQHVLQIESHRGKQWLVASPPLICDSFDSLAWSSPEFVDSGDDEDDLSSAMSEPELVAFRRLMSSLRDLGSAKLAREQAEREKRDRDSGLKAA